MDDFGGTFAINSSTGQVTLNNSLDFETTSSYNLRVIATDSKGVPLEVPEIMQVSDESINFSGTFSDASQTFSEAVPLGTVILNALTSNFDNVTYSLAQDNDAKFTINPVTGQVTLNDLFDFESNSNHSFTIQASVE